MLSKVKEAFHEALGVSVDLVTEKTTMDNLDQWDSMKHMELIMAIENKFNINFEVHEVVELNSVTKLLQLITEKQSGK